jgi:hypothetical protein
MTGYSADDVVGKTSCSILQGQSTDKSGLQELMNEVRFKRSASVMLMNYNKNGEKFRNFIVVYPLSTDSRITHYLALTTYTERVESDGPEGSSNDTALQQANDAPSSGGGFNTSNISASQMQQIMQSQSQAFQEQHQQRQQHSSNASEQDNVASSVAMLQSNMMSAAGQGQMLPPSANSGSIDMQYSVHNMQPQQQQDQGQSQQSVDGAGTQA